MKILVVVAHPDDEVLGCCGTIVKYTQAGDEVHIIVLADGVTSRVYNPKISRKQELKKNKKQIEIRKREFFNAVKILGVKKQNCFLLDLPDQRLDVLPLLDIIKKIERISKKITPEVIYTHHWGDLNKDHRICFEAVLTAFRPSKAINKNRMILCFEIPGNMNILPPKITNRFRPNHFVNITAYVQKKLNAFKAYRSEQRSYPDPLSCRNLLELIKRRAKNRKFKFAEAFEILIK